ncbi:MAG: hypothetical protein ACOYXB_13430 [Bacteroidota bacterium]
MEEQTTRGSLGKKMQDFRETPPDRVWEGIAAHLDAGNGRRRLVFWITLAAGIALALTVGLSVNRYLTGSRGMEELASNGRRELPGSGPTGDSTGNRHTSVVPDVNTEATGQVRTLKPEEKPQSAPAVSRRDKPAGGKVIPAVSVQGDKYADLETAIVPAVSRDDQQQEGEYVVTDSESALASLTETPENEEPNLPADSAGLVIITADALKDVLPDEELLAVEPESKTNWSIAAVLSPLYSYRDADGSLASNTLLNQSETGMLAYAGGVRVAFGAGDGFEVETGLFYNKMGLIVSDIESFYVRALNTEATSGMDNSDRVFELNNSIGNIVPNSGIPVMNSYGGTSSFQMDYLTDPSALYAKLLPSSVLQQSLEYLEIPLNLRYTLLDKAFELQVIGGVSTNVLVGNKVSLITDEGLEDFGHVSNIRMVSYSGNAGLGMIYHLGDQLCLNLEPRFRYFLSSVNTGSMASTRPYAFGFYTGLSYLF